ncbi:MAG: DegT/DnrJ/EryC1/StrS family aminotransferase [Candidatus Micrarchaeota archaeon]
MKYPLIKVDVGEAELAEIKRVLESGYIAQGPTTRRYSEEFAAFTGARHASAVSSCTAGLHLSIVVLNIGEGDEVIVPSFTYPATANVVELERARTVFADIDLQTFNIDVNALEELITEKTKAIMPVHEFGLSADMGPLMKLAEKHGLRVIEDAAPSIGTYYGKKHVGTIGDFGCFSSHPRKILTTGEGGMVTTENEALYLKIESLKSHGIVPGNLMEFERYGFNYRMSDILAAVGLAQLKKLKSTLAKRRELALNYTTLLEGTEGIRPPVEMNYGNHTFQSYVTLLNDGIDRDKVIALLKEKEIQTQIGTFAVHSLPPYRNHEADCPNALTAYKQTLTLPLYNELVESDQEFIVKELRKAIENARRS